MFAETNFAETSKFQESFAVNIFHLLKPVFLLLCVQLACKSLISYTLICPSSLYICLSGRSTIPVSANLPHLAEEGYKLLPDLQWWPTYLEMGKGSYVYVTGAATLVLGFGDSNRTGTGGTFMEYGHAVLFLLQLKSDFGHAGNSSPALGGRPTFSVGSDSFLFYQQHNSTVYWITLSGSSRLPELHKLVEDIRLLELELGC
jgi:hypothetical protein